MEAKLAMYQCCQRNAQLFQHSASVAAHAGLETQLHNPGFQLFQRSPECYRNIDPLFPCPLPSLPGCILTILITWKPHYVILRSGPPLHHHWCSIVELSPWPPVPDTRPQEDQASEPLQETTPQLHTSSLSNAWPYRGRRKRISVEPDERLMVNGIDWWKWARRICVYGWSNRRQIDVPVFTPIDLVLAEFKSKVCLYIQLMRVNSLWRRELNLNGCKLKSSNVCVSTNHRCQIFVHFG